MKYYKTIERPLWNLKGWNIASMEPEEVVALANKRGDGNKLEDVKHIGSVTVILGTADNYEDVINMDDKLKVLK